MLVQQLADLFATERPKLMNEANARVELRVASQAFFHAGHSDQNQAETPAVKNIPAILAGPLHR